MGAWEQAGLQFDRSDIESIREAVAMVEYPYRAVGERGGNYAKT